MSVKFFEPSDFEYTYYGNLMPDKVKEAMAFNCNMKLEKLGIKVGVMMCDGKPNIITSVFDYAKDRKHFTHQSIMLPVWPMNKSVREEIEKAAQDMWDNKNQDYPVTMHAKTIYKQGAEFGYNLALKHASVLREVLEYFSNCPEKVAIGIINGGEYLMLDDYCKSALEQFDKLTKETKETV